MSLWKKNYANYLAVAIFQIIVQKSYHKNVFLMSWLSHSVSASVSVCSVNHVQQAHTRSLQFPDIFLKKLFLFFFLSKICQQIYCITITFSLTMEIINFCHSSGFLYSFFQHLNILAQISLISITNILIAKLNIFHLSMLNLPVCRESRIWQVIMESWTVSLKHSSGLSNNPHPIYAYFQRQFTNL